MNIDKPFTPELVCDRELLVPVYQRLFVWDEDRIRKLLDDLWTAMGANEPYYIGIITVHEKNSVWEVVDGQQRLTFLTLLGCALKNALPSAGKTWECFVLQGQDKCRVSYVGRGADENCVKNYWFGNTSCLKGSFKIFNETFGRFAASVGLKGDQIQKFSEYCYRKTSFLVNCLPPKYEPADLNLYFEKMNSTGKQLAPIDVVKGVWFSAPEYVGEFNRCLNFDKSYDELGKLYGNECKASTDSKESYLGVTLNDVLTRDVNPDTADVGESSATTLEGRLPMKAEMLLLHALSLAVDECSQVIQGNGLFDSKRLIDIYKSAFKNNAGLEGRVIDELVAYRKWIDKNIIWLEGGEQSFEYVFRGKKGDESDDALSEMCQFQSMLYVASGEKQAWILEAYLKSRGLPNNQLTLDVLKTCGMAAKKLDPEKLSYHTIDRYWFWRLDYELWNMVRGNDSSLGVDLDENTREAILRYRFRRNRSIEHLHPQSESTPEWGSRDDSKSEMHQFGNLAMMSVEGNSAQSDDGVGTKFGRVKDWISSGRLESIKMLLMFKLADRSHEGWTVEKSKAHAQRMIDILKNACK